MFVWFDIIIQILPGFTHDIPQRPSQRQCFFLLLQSSSDEHFRRHDCPCKKINNFFRKKLYLNKLICLIRNINGFKLLW